MVPVISEHIEITPGVCGGRPRIASHRIRVQDIVLCHERMGMSPDEIILHHPSITLADVYAALTYYHDHLQEIQQQIAGDEIFAREMEAQTTSLVQQKLKDPNVKNDSVSFG
ncbi:DUF433 domain-containing protein [Gloeobacter violaceus]|uniref:Glr4207 protein n=1 Tax=Gloeobacter violaceus (strain ATCC 29082 / PCC 7421) TaxID=251221 RepID=Q7NDM8_GLOVI|nr:DUF433 domain-containing protein [Gloeobacter violaceus]BAC92148.1 glr4207 [Gloeobacter violaceus PCC 7421]